MAPPLLQSAVVVRLDVGGTPLNTSLATVMEGARQGGEVFECLCAQAGTPEAPSLRFFAQPPCPSWRV